MKMIIDTKKIKLARYKKGMTQREVAHQVGLSCERFSLIESGKGGMHAKNLVKLCKVLDIRVEDVVFFKS